MTIFVSSIFFEAPCIKISSLRFNSHNLYFLVGDKQIDSLLCSKTRAYNTYVEYTTRPHTTFIHSFLYKNGKI